MKPAIIIFSIQQLSGSDEKVDFSSDIDGGNPSMLERQLLPLRHSQERGMLPILCPYTSVNLLE
jgi:hypothetical protein